MSRAIKFRAWHKKLKRMYRVLDIDLEHQMIACPCQDGCETGIDGFYSDEVELMQFTGLLDKHGKEIYEGDILGSYVDDTVADGVVRFGHVDIGANGYEYSYWINGFYVEDIDGQPDESATNRMFKGEALILGNIYENPDLLSKE